MHKVYKETEDSPARKAPRVLVRTSSGHVTPTSSDRKRSQERKELQDLRAKVSYYKQVKGGSELKF